MKRLHHHCPEHDSRVGQSLHRTQTAVHRTGTRTTHVHQEEFGHDHHLLRWGMAPRDTCSGLPASMRGCRHAEQRRRSMKQHKDQNVRRHAHIVKRGRLCECGAAVHRMLNKIRLHDEKHQKKVPMAREQAASSNEFRMKTSCRGPALEKAGARCCRAQSDEEGTRAPSLAERSAREGACGVAVLILTFTPDQRKKHCNVLKIKWSTEIESRLFMEPSEWTLCRGTA